MVDGPHFIVLALENPSDDGAQVEISVDKEHSPPGLTASRETRIVERRARGGSPLNRNVHGPNFDGI